MEVSDMKPKDEITHDKLKSSDYRNGKEKSKEKFETSRRVATKHVARTYRVSLKNDLHVKQNESISFMKKERIKSKQRTLSNDSHCPVDNGGEAAMPKNLSNNGKQRSRVMLKNDERPCTTRGHFKDVHDKPSSFPTKETKRITDEKRRENKKLLENIVAGINLMEEKLSKYETDGGNFNRTAKDIGQISYKKVQEENIEHNINEKMQDGKSQISIRYKKEENGNIEVNDREKFRIQDGATDDKSKHKMTSKRKEKQKNKHLSHDDTNSNSEHEDNHFKSKKTTKNVSKSVYFHPTHFLAFRVHNADIHRKTTEIHTNILNINEDFKRSFIEISDLHLTLAVMDLKNDEEVDMTIKALESSLNKLRDVYSNAVCKFIELDSLDTFQGKVVYIDVKDDKGLELLKSIVSTLKDSFHEENIMTQRETFTPHVTIMKLHKRFSMWKKGIKRIPVDMYATYKDNYFGNEEIIEILLCAMAGKKDGEFYKVLASIDLKNDKLTVFDKTPSCISISSKRSENELEEEDEEDEVIHDIINELIDKVVVKVTDDLY